VRHPLKFNFPDSYDEKQLISELADHYSLKKERFIFESFAVYDTFDWRLFNRSLVLYESGNKFVLRKLFESEIIHRVEITSLPVFIWDFPDSELKEQLAPIIKMRALLRLAEVYSRSTPYRILNQDEKTVARLVSEEIRPSPDKDTSSLATYLWLKPVKGYPRYSQNLGKRLKEAGFAARKKEDIYFEALRVVDKKPGNYTSKLNIQVDPDMRSDEATKAILRFLLHVIRINEANIEKDLDTEFLHDFRVAIRRTRSALGQVKNVFPAEITHRFRKGFAFIGKTTNQMRDLDVYLLNEATYKAMLPAELRDDIDPLFDYLREKRSKAFQEVISSLDSRKYKRILQDWEVFLNEPRQDSQTAPNADIPIIDLARKRIYKKYLRTVKDGTRKKINVLIEQLKKLQDNLGDFNDFCVQEQYLQNIAAELPATNEQSKKALVAIGSLIGTLDREKQTAKDAFAKTFTVYASPANKTSFRELFTSK
jgi:CHAD domain-containing protein